ncbi:MAG: protein translocase subunit SecF [Myxococcales bacterium]|nr:protein translocase subunit SecF [Myxococcales bacterium]
MELIPAHTNFPFIPNRRFGYIFSTSLSVLCIVVFFVRGGFNYGIDFAGGLNVHARFTEAVDAKAIRDAVGTAVPGDTVVQSFGGGVENEYLVRVEEASESDVADLGLRVTKAIEDRFGKDKVQVLSTESVGPQVGGELRKQGLEAFLFAMIGTLIYISFRFEVKYGVGAIVATFHDILVTVGAFVLLDKELTLPIVAAVLTVVGYSLNDTIVVYDRIRENLQRQGKRKTYEEVLNASINETLSRTILTSGTTLLVVVALFFLGGAVIHDFAFVLMVGIAIGTYSSIFVASPCLILWEDYVGKRMKSKPKPKTAEKAA